jgi:hypothetical protein
MGAVTSPGAAAKARGASSMPESRTRFCFFIVLS